MAIEIIYTALGKNFAIVIKNITVFFPSFEVFLTS